MEMKHIDMINRNGLEIENYYKMQPYNFIDNKSFSIFFDEKDFFKYFYVCSCKTFERLSSIASLIESSQSNAMIITGYRGCGKTNFLNFCRCIMEGKVDVPNFNDVFQFEIDNIELFKSQTTKRKAEKKLIENYNDSIEKIKITLFSEFYTASNDYLKANISNVLNDKLKAKCIYINFDADKVEREQPLQLKLSRILEEHIEYIINNQLQYVKTNVISFEFDNRKLITDAFENREPLKLKSIFKYLEKIKNIENYSQIEDELHMKLSDLDSDHLLLIISLIQYSLAIHENTNDRYVYLFDNIDFISDLQNNIFYSTIEAFWSFLREIGSLMDALRKDEEKSDRFKEWLNIYDRTNYLFAMRETTAMHICDHLRDVVRSMSKHMDISADVNKSYVFRKKTNYLNNHKKGIINNSFLEVSNAIDLITADVHFANNLMPLFNNDYRTTVLCICKVCTKNNNIIKKAFALLEREEKYCRFGARGLIYRLFFEQFLICDYLKDIGVNLRIEEKVSENICDLTNTYSYSRLILTVLHNKQKLNSDGFFVNLEESVSINALYEALGFMDADSFVDSLDGMFSIRNKTFWNHLITFDNLFSYSNNNLKIKLNENKTNTDLTKLVLLRTTCAGNTYLDFVCTHFEFFATRFSKNNIPLFDDRSLIRDSKGEYKFEKIIKSVFKSVCVCAKNLKNLNKIILEMIGYDKDDTELLDTPYFYSQMYHEERIIHQHISYIDAFRLYLLNFKLVDDSERVNKILIEFIKSYLKLLKELSEEYYLQNSLKLHDELLACVGLIIEKDYKDYTIRVDRDYYREVIENGK